VFVFVFVFVFVVAIECAVVQGYWMLGAIRSLFVPLMVLVFIRIICGMTGLSGRGE